MNTSDSCRFGEGDKHKQFMDEAIEVNIACGLPPMFGLDEHVDCASDTEIPTKRPATLTRPGLGLRPTNKESI